MKASMSGWSALRSTILALRRVVPPDLMAPAEASAARMKESGPEAVPPPERDSPVARRRERLTPDPEPPLKMTPSCRYQSRMACMSSCTEMMKQALACGGVPSTPMLNHTGELNDAFWCSRMWVNSCEKISASCLLAKYPSPSPQVVMVRTTRSSTSRTERSRRGESSGPRKYFEATTLVANCDHVSGNSTSRCSNTARPFSPVIKA